EGMTGRRASPERTIHPAQFPVAVIDRIVKACSNQGDLVFDPFVGSGTTAQVAIANGRTVIGFETNPVYIDVARTRLVKFLKRKELEQAQQRLSFDG
ncbi:MAG: site-specific DNA-methyltransferase, partial [Chloroflexota bacterium]